MPINKPMQRKSPPEKGSALIEFLCATFFLIFPILLGTFVFGMSLIRANQVAEVCRDAAHMYAYGVDFSQASGQALLVQLAQGLHMTATGGNGVVILSTVTAIAASDCTAAGYQGNSSSCPNINKTVFIRRIVVGNSQLHASQFGTPSASILDSLGNINNTDYLTNSTAVANGFSSVIPLTSGQYAYMAETFVISPDFNIWNWNSSWKWISSGGISARSIF